MYSVVDDNKIIRLLHTKKFHNLLATNDGVHFVVFDTHAWMALLDIIHEADFDKKLR
jgi:hypothetical protein